MKDLSLLVFLTQLGLSVAAPLIGAVLLALWLQEYWGWGQWILWVGIGIGILCAVDGFRNTLKLMQCMSKNKKDSDSPSISFNNHD